MNEKPPAAAPHRFNRFEMKYLVPEANVPALRADIAQHLGTDPLASEPYRVESLYFDTADLRFYWEKLDGIKFRRKLRIRHYGSDPEGATAKTPVQVEIKQRVNKVTQKRRLALPFPLALSICDSTGLACYTPVPEDALMEAVAEPHRRVLSEIRTLSANLRLRPTAVTSYLREAYSGFDQEAGVRITFDHSVSGRDRDFILGRESGIAQNRPIIDPSLCVVELKSDERLPFWLTDLTAHHALNLVRMSKYCATIEAFDLAPATLTEVEQVI